MIMSNSGDDCKRIPFEPSNEEKFHISEITGTKTDKNDVRYYKVKWEQTWIPASRLRAWHDLIIQFWEGYHANNNQKIVELDSPCDQTPQVYVLTSDSESRDEIQVVASTNSEKRELAAEQDISSSVNFDNYPEEEASDNERNDDMYVDNEKISILGHKRVKIVKQRQPRLNMLPTPDSVEHQSRPPDDCSVESSPYVANENERIIKQEMIPPLERERVKESMYNPFVPRVDGGMPHLAPDHRSFISMEKNPPPNRDLYHSPTYRMSISPTSTRDPHELQVVSTYSARRNSLSPHHENQNMFENSMPQKKAFYCYLCGKEYRSGTGLKQHLLAHKNEKPFGCNICHRRYRWKGDLNRHMYTHLPNNELPLKCPECNKGFVRKDKMQLHINFAHAGSNNTTNNEDAKPPPPPVQGVPTSTEENNIENNHLEKQIAPPPLALPPP